MVMLVSMNTPAMDAVPTPTERYGRQIWPGKPTPLGSTFDGSGTNFALFSEVADLSLIHISEPTRPY